MAGVLYLKTSYTWDEKEQPQPLSMTQIEPDYLSHKTKSLQIFLEWPRDVLKLATSTDCIVQGRTYQDWVLLYAILPSKQHTIRLIVSRDALHYVSNLLVDSQQRKLEILEILETLGKVARRQHHPADYAVAEPLQTVA